MALGHLMTHAEAKKTVLICDDEPDVRLLFGDLFRSKYNVILAGSGEECIEKYIEETSRGNRISLIILDYKLGGMWGDAVAHKIKEYTGTKIILNSAYNIDDVVVKELEDGNYISKYVRKPVTNDFLIDLVTEAIKN